MFDYGILSHTLYSELLAFQENSTGSGLPCKKKVSMRIVYVKKTFLRLRCGGRIQYERARIPQIQMHEDFSSKRDSVLKF